MGSIIFSSSSVAFGYEPVAADIATGVGVEFRIMLLLETTLFVIACAEVTAAVTEEPAGDDANEDDECWACGIEIGRGVVELTAFEAVPELVLELTPDPVPMAALLSISPKDCSIHCFNSA
jgi:hypothetical protein